MWKIRFFLQIKCGRLLLRGNYRVAYGKISRIAFSKTASFRLARFTSG